MKLLVIAVCTIAAVTADVSHLADIGYNYEKPSIVFDVPQQATTIHQQLLGSSKEYLPPQAPYAAPAPAIVHHNELPTIQSSSNEYLPPQQQYSTPVHHHEISQPLASVHHQEITQAPSSEYLPPQMQHSTTAGAGAKAHHQENSQPISAHLPQYSAPSLDQFYQQQIAPVPSKEYLPQQPQDSTPDPAPVHQEGTSQSVFPSQLHYSAPAPDTINQQEISQPIQDSYNKYFPTPPQQTVAALDPTSHQEFSQAIPAPQSQYYAPSSQGRQLNTQSIYTSSNEYLPPQQQYSTPINAPIPQGEQEPIATISNDYLPPQQQPALGHHQQLPQSISATSNEYLPPNEQHQYHHQDDNHLETHSDGYHYDAPAKRFRF